MINFSEIPYFDKSIVVVFCRPFQYFIQKYAVPSLIEIKLMASLNKDFESSDIYMYMYIDVFLEHFAIY